MAIGLLQPCILTYFECQVDIRKSLLKKHTVGNLSYISRPYSIMKYYVNT